MDVRAVFRNFKNIGFRKTIELRRERNIQRKQSEKVDPQELAAFNAWCSCYAFNASKDVLDAETEYRALFTERPQADLCSLKVFNLYMQRAKELEDALCENPQLRRNLLDECKAHYIKTLIPAAYKQLAERPVEHKLVFMENGNCPSPSNAHLINVLQKQYDYAIHKTGLKKRQVSMLEYYENALRFAQDAATAKAVFLTTANDIFSHIEMRKETKLIQLWHGVGMFKRVGWSTVNKSFGLDAAVRQEYDQYRNYSYVTIAGEAQAWTFEDAMHIPADAGIIVPVGIARTDVFYSSAYRDNSYKMLYKEIPQARGKKILFYAPTFRGSVANAKAPDQLDIESLGKALSNEYVLLIKHHGTVKDIPPIPDKWRNTFAFDMSQEHKSLSIDRLLAISDICITDYSSIGFEFAIMERPLIFFAYDLEDYLDKRGMYYNYDEITPGPICKTTEEIVDHVIHIKDRFDKQGLLDFKQRYVGACDGHATERTIALIEA